MNIEPAGSGKMLAGSFVQIAIGKPERAKEVIMLTPRRTIEAILAEQMGYEHCILFPRGRDALGAYSTHADVVLPSNICPEIAEYASKIVPVDDYGMGGCAQLYGYHEWHEYDLNLDPLITGWVTSPISQHSIISFGRYKMTKTYGGGALLTSDKELYEIFVDTYIPPALLEPIYQAINNMDKRINKCWEKMEEWDRCLGGLLERIPKEQIMPWRCMRMALPQHRDGLVGFLRMKRVAVSTNYPPLPGQPANKWGRTVIGFPLHQSPEKAADAIQGYWDYLLERKEL